MLPTTSKSFYEYSKYLFSTSLWKSQSSLKKIMEVACEANPQFRISPLRLLTIFTPLSRNTKYFNNESTYLVNTALDSVKKNLNNNIFEELTAWIEDNNAMGNKIEAAKRIKTAFDNNFEILDLSLLELTSIPSCIGRLDKLKILDLNYNKLNCLPSTIGRLSKLERLFIRNNELTTLPVEIDKLSSLTVLELGTNHFSVFPQVIGTLNQLKILLFGVNKLEHFDTTIFKLQQLEILCLVKNKIQNIPAEICQLQELRHLSLGKNQITVIPAEIGQLRHLGWLSLNNNKLEAVPAEIEKLSQLHTLELSHNQLNTLPVEIGNLRNIESLHLDHNRLVSLPSEIGQLSKMIIFKIDHNAELVELPLTLGEIATLTFVDNFGTGIPDSLISAINSACRSKRDIDGRLTLPFRIKAWLAASGKNADPKKYEDFTNPQKNDTISMEQKSTINEWLYRLERTRDYNDYQHNLAVLACGMLESLLANQEFKEYYFGQAEPNNVNCGDRGAMAFNELYTSWLLITILDRLSIKEKLKIMIGLAKTFALRKILKDKITIYEKQRMEEANKKRQFYEGEKEDVEIFLYYEMTLQEKLNLQTAIKSMISADIGKRSWINQAELIKEINNTYLSHLINLSIFDKIVDSDFKKIWTPLEKKYSDEMEQLNNDNSLTENQLLEKNKKLMNKKEHTKTIIAKKWLAKFDL